MPIFGLMYRYKREERRTRCAKRCVLKGARLFDTSSCDGVEGKWWYIC